MKWAIEYNKSLSFFLRSLVFVWDLFFICIFWFFCIMARVAPSRIAKMRYYLV